MLETAMVGGREDGSVNAKARKMMEAHSRGLEKIKNQQESRKLRKLGIRNIDPKISRERKKNALQRGLVSMGFKCPARPFSLLKDPSESDLSFGREVIDGNGMWEGWRVTLWLGSSDLKRLVKCAAVSGVPVITASAHYSDMITECAMKMKIPFVKKISWDLERDFVKPDFGVHVITMWAYLHQFCGERGFAVDSIKGGSLSSRERLPEIKRHLTYEGAVSKFIKEHKPVSIPSWVYIGPSPKKGSLIGSFIKSLFTGDSLVHVWCDEIWKLDENQKLVIKNKDYGKRVYVVPESALSRLNGSSVVLCSGRFECWDLSKKLKAIPVLHYVMGERIMTLEEKNELMSRYFEQKGFSKNHVEMQAFDIFKKYTSAQINDYFYTNVRKFLPKSKFPQIIPCNWDYITSFSSKTAWVYFGKEEAMLSMSQINLILNRLFQTLHEYNFNKVYMVKSDGDIFASAMARFMQKSDEWTVKELKS